MTEEQAISDYVDAMIQLQIDSEEKYNSERFAKLKQENPNWLADGKARGLPNAIQVANDILNQDKKYIYLKFRHGGFDPRNKATRKLFFNLTGIKLPPTQRDTDTVLRGYIGEAYCVEQERLRQEEKDAKEAERVRLRDEAEAKRIESIKRAFLLNKDIDGEQLVSLAKALNIDVPGRTAGMVRKKISGINGNYARTSGKNINSAFRLYHEVKNVLLARNE